MDPAILWLISSLTSHLSAGGASTVRQALYWALVTGYLLLKFIDEQKSKDLSNDPFSKAMNSSPSNTSSSS